MRIVFRVLGWISSVFGILLCVLGVEGLPAGGLMFALPFFFLIPGIGLTILGGVLLFFTRVKLSTDLESKESHIIRSGGPGTTASHLLVPDCSGGPLGDVRSNGE